MDDTSDWLGDILTIVQNNPEPRQTALRPIRPDTLIYDKEDISGASLTVNIKRETPVQSKSGRRVYAEVLHNRHAYFFDKIIRQCAARMTGLIVCFSAEHPMADFGFCQYTWESDEQEALQARGTPPRTISDLPSNTQLIPIYLLARDLKCQFTGAAVNQGLIPPAQFAIRPATDDMGPLGPRWARQTSQHH
ncbi:MAG: hypothetical protein Q9210_003856 [Variospora velana]